MFITVIKTADLLHAASWIRKPTSLGVFWRLGRGPVVAGNIVLFIVSARGTLRRFEEGQITKQLYRAQFNWQAP